MEELGEAGNDLGFTYIGLPALPEERRKNPDDYKRISNEFIRIDERAKKVNLRFLYHNHGYGLTDMEGQIPINIFPS